MRKLKVLWVDDNINFGPGIHLRYEDDLLNINVELIDPKPHLVLINGEYVNGTIVTHQPDLVMMDHNLDDVKINGANLIINIRHIDSKVPIIYYSTEMNDALKELVQDENNVKAMQRGDVESSFFTLIKKEFSL